MKKSECKGGFSLWELMKRKKTIFISVDGEQIPLVPFFQEIKTGTGIMKI